MPDADECEPNSFDDNPLAGVPELMQETPTALVKIYAVFSVQHVVTELRFQFAMGNLTRGDRAMIAQLGKEIAEELEKEN